MLPHEVVRHRQEALSQHHVRPASRQIEPTARANGRFATELRDERRRLAESDPTRQQHMISKTQALFGLSSTPSPTRADARPRSPQKALSPSRPNRSGSGSTRPVSPARHVGRAIVHPNTVLPPEISSQASVFAADGALTALGGEAEVVRPGSTYSRQSPDRSGFSLHHQHPTSIVSDAALTVLRSPAKAKTVLERIARTRHQDGTAHHHAQTHGKGSAGNGHASDLSSIAMAQLLVSYGLTSEDLVPDTHAAMHHQPSADDDGVEGASVRTLAPPTQFTVNLRSLQLGDAVPENTFQTLLPPRIAHNPKVWISATDHAAASATTAQDRRNVGATAHHNTSAMSAKSALSVSVASASVGTGAAAAPAVPLDAPAAHLFVDLSRWAGVEAPLIRLPQAVQFVITVAEHLIDRSMAYEVRCGSEATDLFAKEPLVWEDGTLELAPNPSVCTTVSLFFRGIDTAAVCPDSGLPMVSEELHCMLHINTAPEGALLAALDPQTYRRLLVQPTLETHHPVPPTTTSPAAEPAMVSTSSFGGGGETDAAWHQFGRPDLCRLRDDACLRDCFETIYEKKMQIPTDAVEGALMTEGSPAMAALRPWFPSVLTCADVLLLEHTFHERFALLEQSVRGPAEISKAIAAIEANEGHNGIGLCQPLLELAAASLRRGAAGQGDALEALERISRIRGLALGFEFSDEIGVKPLPASSSGTEAGQKEEVQGHVFALVESLLRAGACMAHFGRYGEALEVAETTLRACTVYIGKDAEQTLNALCLTAELHLWRSDFASADRVLQSAHEVAELLRGSASALAQRLLLLSGIACCERGEYSDGIAFFRRVLRDRQATSTATTRSHSTTPSKSTNPNNTSMNAQEFTGCAHTLLVAECNALVAYWTARENDGYVSALVAEDSVAGLLASVRSALVDVSEQLHADAADKDAICGAVPALARPEEPLGRSDLIFTAARLWWLLSATHSLRGSAEAVACSQEATRVVRSVVAPHDAINACLEADVVARRLSADLLFVPENIPQLEENLAHLSHALGEGHPACCKAVALLAQLTRYHDVGDAHAGLLRAGDHLRACLHPSPAVVRMTCAVALVTLQKAGSVALSGPARDALVATAFDLGNDALHMIAHLDHHHGSSHASQEVFSLLVSHVVILLYSAAGQPLPSEFVQRIERNVARQRDLRGDTSQALVEPLIDLGTCLYLAGDFHGAHHHFSRALKIADTINLIFLLGHTFKPAVHLTAAQVQERGRVAGERLMPHQPIVFAIILAAIGGTYAAEGRNDEAQGTYLQAQAALELADLQTSLATTEVLLALSHLLYREGHYGDALAHAEKAATCLRDQHVTVGASSPNTASPVPSVGIERLRTARETIEVILHRCRSKGYTLVRQHDARYRFVVYL